MSGETSTIDRMVEQKYQHGFVTDIESDTIPPGLSEDVIRGISARKNEPEWLLEWRLKAYRHWLEMEQPDWAHLQFSLGKAHAEQGELALAVQAFREAVRIAPNFVDALFHLGLVLRAQNQLSDAVDPLRQAAEGGSRDAQGLLASMYVNGNGVDRNMPLAMLWWSRSSRASIPDTMTRTAQNQLAQLRRRLHREQFTPTERQDVLTGFSLIRQDLANHTPVQVRASALPENAEMANAVLKIGIVSMFTASLIGFFCLENRIRNYPHRGCGYVIDSYLHWMD